MALTRTKVREMSKSLGSVRRRLEEVEKRLDRLDGGVERTVRVSTDGGIFVTTVPPGEDETRYCAAEADRRYGDHYLLNVTRL